MHILILSNTVLHFVIPYKNVDVFPEILESLNTRGKTHGSCQKHETESLRA